MEAIYCDLPQLMKYGEELVSHVCQEVARKNVEELKELGQDPAELKKVKAPFPKITYKEALDILAKNGMKVKYGKDLRTLEERELVKHFEKPVFVTNYPKEIMAFYKPEDPENPGTALCFDLIIPEVGELIGGSVRDLDVDAMKKVLKEEGEDLSTYDWYFDTRKYGAVPHAGFGMGVERLVMWICGLEHIRDTIPFPRTINRNAP
jgi:asparaginyl-tRNA synthetase